LLGFYIASVPSTYKFKEKLIPSTVATGFEDLLLFIQVYCPYAALGYERPTPHLLTDINIHSDTQAVPRKLSSPTLYIDLWQEGKPAPGQNPPVISPPVVIFRRISVRAEIQNPVLSNTRLVKIVPLSHLRRRDLRTDLLLILTPSLSTCLNPQKPPNIMDG
jgi:hypothetical protein